MKLPIVLAQFCAQPPLLVKHSLISGGGGGGGGGGCSLCSVRDYFITKRLYIY